jgi:hypothetical protein
MAVSPDAVEYVLLNVGVLDQPAPAAAEPVLMNVGVLDAPSPAAAEPVLMNVGVLDQPASADAEPVLLNALNTTRTNQIKNPSFEVDTTGWTFQSSTTLTRDTTQFNTGVASMKAVSTIGNIRVAVYGATSGSGVAANADSIAVTIGQQVTVSAWVKVASGTAQHRVKIHWFNSGGSFLSDSDGALIAMSTSWQRLQVTATAPANTAKFGISVQQDAAATTFIDSVLAEISPALGDYFDGSIAAPSGYQHAWTGPANASTSTETLTTVAFKQRESGAWVAHTAVPKVRVAGAWVVKRPKRWSGTAWVDLP